jgi:hypothetical protein
VLQPGARGVDQLDGPEAPLQLECGPTSISRRVMVWIDLDGGKDDYQGRA